MIDRPGDRDALVSADVRLRSEVGKRIVGQRGALDEAESLLEPALADAQDDPDLLNTLAMIAHRKGAPGKARELIGRALRVRGDDPRLWFNYGLACASSGALSEARQAFARVLDLAPGHAGAAQWLARLAA